MSGLTSLVRALITPIGIILGKYLEPWLGPTFSVVTGTTIATSLVDIIIGQLETIGQTWFGGIWHYIMRTSVTFQVHNEEVNKTITQWFQDNMPGSIKSFYYDDNDIMQITGFLPGTKLMINDRKVKPGVSESKIQLSYPRKSLTPQQIMDFFQVRLGDKLREIFFFIWKNGWYCNNDICHYSLSNTFYTKHVMDKFINPVQKFLAGSWNMKSHLPQRLTFILYSSQNGMGKTRSIQILFPGVPVFLVPLNLVFAKRKEKDRETESERFFRIMNSIKNKIMKGKPYVIVFDEFDKIWCDYDTREAYRNIMYSWLDGALPETGRIVIFTVNDMRDLRSDPGLLRPGRVTDVVEFDLPDEHQLGKTLAYLRPHWNVDVTRKCKIPIAKIIHMLEFEKVSEEKFVELAMEKEVVEIAKNEEGKPSDVVAEKPAKIQVTADEWIDKCVEFAQLYYDVAICKLNLTYASVCYEISHREQICRQQDCGLHSILRLCEEPSSCTKFLDVAGTILDDITAYLACDEMERYYARAREIKPTIEKFGVSEPYFNNSTVITPMTMRIMAKKMKQIRIWYSTRKIARDSKK